MASTVERVDAVVGKKVIPVVELVIKVIESVISLERIWKPLRIVTGAVCQRRAMAMIYCVVEARMMIRKEVICSFRQWIHALRLM